MSGRPITVPWTSFVSKGLVVKGFSLRQWMSANKKKVPKMMETIAKLVNADKLRVEYTEYELSAEVRGGPQRKSNIRFSRRGRRGLVDNSI